MASPASAANFVSGRNPDGEDNDVRRESRALLRADDDAASIIGVESVHPIVQLDVYTLIHHALMNELGHLTIQRRHQLIRHFDDGYLQTPTRQVFRHFEPDKATSDHHRSSSRPGLHPFPDFATIRYGA
jgi:hypothetical protein